MNEVLDVKDQIEQAESQTPSGALATQDSPGALAITEGPGALLSAIIGLAKDKDFDVGKLQALMGMQERLEDRQAERAFAAALTAAQAEMPQVERMGTVDLGQGKGSYAFARLEDMDRVLRPIMIKHGFSVYFDRVQREGQGGGLVVTGTLSHVMGHSKTASFPVALDAGPGRNNLQAAGSADSYARRYILEGFFLIVRKGKDDDGVAHGKRYIEQPQADELRDLCKRAGRQEGTILDRIFSGQVKSFEEVEVGGAYLAVKNTLDGLAKQQAAKGTA